MEEHKEHTLGRRYLSKLAAQFISLIITFIMQAIVPRSLGPKNYGSYSFLQDYFNKIISFFDVGTSTAFFTKLSQRKNEFSIISFYFRLLTLVFSLVIGFAVGVSVFSLEHYFFPDQEWLFILMAAFVVCIFFLSEIFFKITDAYGLTVFSEKIRVFSRLLSVILVIVLFALHRLNLLSFYITLIVQYGLLTIALVLLLGRNSKSIFRENWSLSLHSFKSYFMEFFSYSKPLLLLSLIGTLAGILERLILQKFSGSSAQGFYGLSYAIGQICFLFTSSMTPLFMREISISFANNRLDEIKASFSRLAPLLFLISSYFACFIAVNSQFVVVLLGGKNFSDAAFSLTIMAFYPIHQTYGQLTASVFFATNDTKKYSVIGLVFIGLGLALTYFTIAPHVSGGLDMGSAGLSIKMVAIQFFAVNVSLFFIAKKYRLGFLRLLGHQAFCIVYFTASAYLIKLFCSNVFENNIIVFFFGGLAYTTISILLLYFFPAMFGLSLADRNSLKSKISNMIKRQ